LPVTHLNIETNFHVEQIFWKKIMITVFIIKFKLILKFLNDALLVKNQVHFSALGLLLAFMSSSLPHAVFGQDAGALSLDVWAPDSTPAAAWSWSAGRWTNPEPLFKQSGVSPGMRSGISSAVKSGKSPGVSDPLSHQKPIWLLLSSNTIASSAHAQHTHPARLELPPVPLGFFCRFEDRLSQKLPLPLDFGTD
jgi:hypothetical protein